MLQDLQVSVYFHHITREAEKLHSLNRKKTNLDQLKKACLFYIKTGYNYETYSSAVLLQIRTVCFVFFFLLLRLTSTVDSFSDDVC